MCPWLLESFWSRPGTGVWGIARMRSLRGEGGGVAGLLVVYGKVNINKPDTAVCYSRRVDLLWGGELVTWGVMGRSI